MELLSLLSDLVAGALAVFFSFLHFLRLAQIQGLSLSSFRACLTGPNSGLVVVLFWSLFNWPNSGLVIVLFFELV